MLHLSDQLLTAAIQSTSRVDATGLMLYDRSPVWLLPNTAGQ